MERKFYIAGMKFHQIHEVIDKLHVGVELDLIPEPTNKFDPNAVKIVYVSESDTETMLGYVPKKFSAEIAGLLETGIEMYCEVTKVDKTAKTWEQCEVVIKIAADLDEGEDEDSEQKCPICGEGTGACNCQFPDGDI